jgi:hypothetical protein
MAFRINDLIIDLRGGARGEEICGPATKIAAVGALCGPATKMLDLAALCGPATKLGELVPLATLAAAAGGPPGARLDDLEALRRQLRDALACIEGGEPGMPQTRAETEDLEEKLRAALAELAEHKKRMK